VPLGLFINAVNTAAAAPDANYAWQVWVASATQNNSHSLSVKHFQYLSTKSFLTVVQSTALVVVFQIVEAPPKVIPTLSSSDLFDSFRQSKF
jgi:hypothetical protein